MPGQRRNARRWTAAQLDDFATVTERDLEAAADAWRRFAPQPWRAMLDAEAVVDDDDRESHAFDDDARQGE